MQADVAGERPGQQPGLTQHLKSVADTEDGQPVAGRVHDRADHGGKTSNRPGAKIVAIGESAGQHHRVHPAQLGVTMPERNSLATAELDGVRGVPVIQGARKGHHTNSSRHR